MNKLAIHTHVNFTFPFVSTFRQTDFIFKKKSKTFRGTGYSLDQIKSNQKVLFKVGTFYNI